MTTGKWRSDRCGYTGSRSRRPAHRQLRLNGRSLLPGADVNFDSCLSVWAALSRIALLTPTAAGYELEKMLINIAYFTSPFPDYRSRCGTLAVRSKQESKKKKKSLNITARNVRKFFDRDNTDRHHRRTAFIASELARYKINIAAFNETKMADEGELRRFQAILFSEADMHLMINAKPEEAKPSRFQS